MAQHIPIESFKQKRFKTIKKGILKAFKNPYMKTSMKYIYDPYLQKTHRIDSDDEVYITEYYIGKGFIHGSDRGSFEIHFNKKTKKVTNIYLVA